MPTPLSAITAELLHNKDVRSGYFARTAVIEAADLCRQMRQAAGLTQDQLARRLDVKQARIARIESGKGVHGPSVDVLSRVAAACGKKLVIKAEAPPRKEVVCEPV